MSKSMTMFSLIWFAFLLINQCLTQKVPDQKVSEKSGVILPSLIIFIGLVAIIGTIINDYIKSNSTLGQPEEQFNMILCHEHNAPYQYNLVFRVGCPSDNFDMKNGFVEFIILGPEDEPIGTPVRFDCSLIPDRICGEMHCLIGRISPMPKINGIRAYHGDRDGTIFLYEYVLFDLIEENVIEITSYHEYLTNQPKTYRGTPLTNEDGEEVGLYPELPLMEWTNIELVIFSFFILMANGSMVMLLEYYNIYPAKIKDQQGSLYRSLLDVLISLIPCVFLLGIVTLTYKYCIKRNVLRTEYSTLDDETAIMWQRLSYAYLTIFGLFSVGLIGVFISLGKKISFIKSVYWLCTTKLLSAFVFGVWAAANKSHWFKSLFDENVEAQAIATSGQQQFDSSNSSEQQKMVTNQSTVFFSNNNNQQRQKNNNINPISDNVSDLSSFGPKLKNPMRINKMASVNKNNNNKNKGETSALTSGSNKVSNKLRRQKKNSSSSMKGSSRLRKNSSPIKNSSPTLKGSSRRKKSSLAKNSISMKGKSPLKNKSQSRRIRTIPNMNNSKSRRKRKMSSNKNEKDLKCNRSMKNDSSPSIKGSLKNRKSRKNNTSIKCRRSRKKQKS
ncbi:hypothetical protein BLOT_014281 [Blomia tropicalis]|nr:hypothetical protein BLOT_014281 [Blomia tropicalis]